MMVKKGKAVFLKIISIPFAFAEYAGADMQYVDKCRLCRCFKYVSSTSCMVHIMPFSNVLTVGSGDAVSQRHRSHRQYCNVGVSRESRAIVQLAMDIHSCRARVQLLHRHREGSCGQYHPRQYAEVQSHGPGLRCWSVYLPGKQQFWQCIRHCLPHRSG